MLVVLEGILWTIRFFFGACIFSFLTVVIDRLPRGENVVRGRSHCTSCGRELTAWELIPCVSFLCLGGKCRGCGERIPLRCFWTVIFAYLGILLVVALIDWDTQMIYDRFHIMILILAVFDFLLYPERGIVTRLIGALIISVPMLILALVIPGAFGGGDIKLMAASGLLLGTASIVCAMFIGIVTGGGYAAVMLAGKKLEKKDQFAFGPFLALGLAAAVFWGNQIAAWYLHFL